MKNETLSYLLASISIIRRNYLPLLLLLAVSMIFFIPLIQDPSNISYFFFGSILMLFLYPSIYGQYTEITLKNRQIGYLTLLKRHCLNFIIVTIILGSPIVFISMISSVNGKDLPFLGLISSILISSLSIYILPLLFIHEKKWESIKVGSQCILGNFQFNFPLIVIVSITTTLTFLFSQPESDASSTYNIITYCFVTMFSLFVEFWLFVAAILILKDKGLA